MMAAQGTDSEIYHFLKAPSFFYTFFLLLMNLPNHNEVKSIIVSWNGRKKDNRKKMAWHIQIFENLREYSKRCEQG